MNYKQEAEKLTSEISGLLYPYIFLERIESSYIDLFHKYHKNYNILLTTDQMNLLESTINLSISKLNQLNKLYNKLDIDIKEKNKLVYSNKVLKYYLMLLETEL